MKTSEALKELLPSREQLIGEWIEARASQCPEAIAIEAQSDRVTYGQLMERSAGLAATLQRYGVGRGSIVGLYLKPSAAFVTAALAVMRSGSTYLPIDISIPKARLEQILEDSGISVVISTARLREPLSTTGCRVIEVLQDGRQTADPSCQAGFESVRAVPLDAAYVIYTSGSTGTPKGVVISHGNLANLVKWHLQAFDVTARCRASQIASLGFDAAVWEIWPYLVAGATICIAEAGLARYPELLRDWLIAQNVEICFAPTPAAERLLALEWPFESALRLLLTGADVLHRPPLPGLPFRLINNYGPTECAVVATSVEVMPEVSGQLPPIGFPIANVEVKVLNTVGNPVPDGEEGELVIGGECVGLAYFNQPGLTAEKFRPDPWSSAPGARAFHTGDRAVRLETGACAFLGRLDAQIKIRGYRIEPAEIEAVLNKHQQVRESAVIALDMDNGKELVSYVAFEPGPLPTARSLRALLVDSLPPHLIPSRFVSIASLPLNSAGKVDRKLLPAPTSANIVQGESYVAPRTPAEKALAAIVALLLGVDSVSVDDNFFMLGGHSLFGTQLIGRVREAFHVELPLRSVFEVPTVSELAAEIESLVLSQLDELEENDALSLALGLGAMEN